MGKAVYIAEKPSVAQEFAKALKLNAKRKDGYLESEEAIVTWCVGSGTEKMEFEHTAVSSAGVSV